MTLLHEIAIRGCRKLDPSRNDFSVTRSVPANLLRLIGVAGPTTSPTGPSASPGAKSSGRCDGIDYGSLVELIVNAVADLQPGFFDWERYGAPRGGGPASCRQLLVSKMEM